ncbi:ras and Rab interactor 3 isoform X2 [Pyxicephalus adspersus]|uniref:ras and Rab interactor 3 isoform X2 n=1 Tax=Pyxicephalus adspersus TaxID=30357 RepID=UPI003B5B7F92
MEDSHQDSGSTDGGVPEVLLCSNPVPNGRLPSPGISILDRLIKTCPVWLQLCMSPEHAASVLRQEAPGVFLVTRDVETKCMVLWVHFSERRDPADVLRYNIREEKTMMYLEGSFLIFEDIFKLIGFYCVSRDILQSPLRLPHVISKARTLKDLETLSNLGSGFWDSSIRDKRGSLISHAGKLPSCGPLRSGDPADVQSDCACEIELLAGSGRLWFVNPIFIEQCGNAQTDDEIPLTNCVAKADVQLPKVVYRRPPPPPPPLFHKPPLPSVPPSAPPPDYIHSHSHSPTLSSPKLVSSTSCSSEPSLISPHTDSLPSSNEVPLHESVSQRSANNLPSDELLTLNSASETSRADVAPSSPPSSSPSVEPLTLCGSDDPSSADAKPLESEFSPTSTPNSETSSPECKTDLCPSLSAASTLNQPENSAKVSPNIERTSNIEGSSNIEELSIIEESSNFTGFSNIGESPNIEGSLVTEDHSIKKPSAEMRISNSEEKKETSENDVHSGVSPIRTPVRAPPAVPKRRPSGKVPENVSNVLSVKLDPQDKTSLSSPKSSSMAKVKPLVKHTESHQESNEELQQKTVGSPGDQQKESEDKKKTPPVPPPRVKKLSSKYNSTKASQQKPDPKSPSEPKQSPRTEIHNNVGSVKIRDKKERSKSLASQEKKGSDSSLNSPTSEPNTPSSNPELDSNSTSSADEDSERPTGASLKKSHSFMLDRAKNRLSIVAITNVFSAFMSADRKLQKRITELAHDKDSYFGNLVQDYKAYSLEMMAKQSSSTEMLQEIRLMMTQLKSYLVQSTELKSMVDYNLYTDDKIDAIVEAALCKCVLKPLKSPIECYLREIHNKDGSMRLLTENQLVIQDTTTTELGVTTSVPDSSVMEKIIQKFVTMHKTYSPEKKITYLLKACKLIYDSMATGNPGKHHGADDFLPVLMYVLARCDLVALLLDVEYMMELMDPSLQLGEGSYYLTTTYGALEHIKNYDKITVTRQLSLEVQDSIHRWERRRTLNKAKLSRSSIQDFITISFEELEVSTRTLATKSETRVAQVLQQCAEKFEVSDPQKYGLYVLINEQYYRLADDALPQQVKARLLKNEQKLVFHFLYKMADEQDVLMKDLDFL